MLVSGSLEVPYWAKEEGAAGVALPPPVVPDAIPVALPTTWPITFLQQRAKVTRKGV